MTECFYLPLTINLSKVRGQILVIFLFPPEPTNSIRFIHTRHSISICWINKQFWPFLKKKKSLDSQKHSFCQLLLLKVRYWPIPNLNLQPIQCSHSSFRSHCLNYPLDLFSKLGNSFNHFLLKLNQLWGFGSWKTSSL